MVDAAVAIAFAAVVDRRLVEETERSVVAAVVRTAVVERLNVDCMDSRMEAVEAAGLAVHVARRRAARNL